MEFEEEIKTTEGLRSVLKEYEKVIKEAGGEVQWVDYDMGMAARFGDDSAFVVCKQFRPERDGYIGIKIMTREFLANVIEEKLSVLKKTN